MTTTDAGALGYWSYILNNVCVHGTNI